MSGSREVNDYLIARHAGFHTDEGAIFDLVMKATTCKPKSREKVVRGNDNEVYIVHTEEMRDFVVRIKRSGELTLAQESWAIEVCNNAGVRVPKVRFVGSVESDGESLEVMIQEAVSGKPLSDLASDLRDGEFQRALYQAGEELAKLHDIKVDGFYQYDLEHGWDFQSWDEIAASMVHDRSQEQDLILLNGFTQNEFRTMIELLTLYCEKYVCLQPVLCHGDYVPNHLFYNEDLEFTGMIDFGMFQGGPPVHDLAVFHLNRNERELCLLLQGYRSNLAVDDEFLARIYLHTIALGIGFLAHETRVGDTHSAWSTAARLRDTLRWCQRHI